MQSLLQKLLSAAYKHSFLFSMLLFSSLRIQFSFALFSRAYTGEFNKLCFIVSNFYSIFVYCTEHEWNRIHSVCTVLVRSGKREKRRRETFTLNKANTLNNAQIVHAKMSEENEPRSGIKIHQKNIRLEM